MIKRCLWNGEYSDALQAASQRKIKIDKGETMESPHLVEIITGLVLTAFIFYVYIDARRHTNARMNDPYPVGYFLGYNWVGLIEFLSTIVIWTFVFFFTFLSRITLFFGGSL